MSYDAADSVSNLSKNIILIQILENAYVANTFDG